MSYAKAKLSASSRIVLAGIFWVAVRVFYRIEIHGLEYVRGKDPAFFAMAHKRDLDPLVEVPSLLAHRGWRALTANVHFALRGDAFSPGFLARVVRYPRWLARCLRPLSIGTLLHGLGMRPLENIHLRPAEVWLHNWLEMAGDGRADEVMTPNFLHQMSDMSGQDSAQLGASPLSHLLAWPYQGTLQSWYSVDIFGEPARHRLKQVELRKLKQELANLTSWLTRGGSMWGAPEGRLSNDGTLGSFTPVLDRLLHGSPAQTCVIPVCISYDFMTPRRSAIFVNVAPPIEQAAQQPARDLERQLRLRWLLGTYFTCTQLASGFLVKTHLAGSRSFTSHELAAYLQQQAAMLSMAGRHVDRRLLSPRSSRGLARRFLEYACRRQLARADHTSGEKRWEPTIGSLTMQVAPGETGYGQAPLAYAWNELREMLSVGPLASMDAASCQQLDTAAG